MPQLRRWDALIEATNERSCDNRHYGVSFELRVSIYKMKHTVIDPNHRHDWVVELQQMILQGTADDLHVHVADDI